MSGPQHKKSDLPVRVASAVVMVAVAGAALWLGGWAFTIFATLVALGVYYEWWGLITKLSGGAIAQSAWMLGGAGYIGVAAFSLIEMRGQSLSVALQALLVVIAVDVGAYFAGRSIGGPKIAPRISPSKTWAGLLGGFLGATIVLALAYDSCIVEDPVTPWEHWKICSGIQLRGMFTNPTRTLVGLLFMGALVAIVAQSGDFFESWMKRRAGVKDSGVLIPGHGGLFDRTDGLIALLFVFGLPRLLV